MKGSKLERAKERMREKYVDVVANFDFERCHKMMKAVDWKWSTKAGYTVPSLREIEKTCEEIFVTMHKEWTGRTDSYGTGGFYWIISKDEETFTLELQFRGEDVSSCFIRERKDK